MATSSAWAACSPVTSRLSNSLAGTASTSGRGLHGPVNGVRSDSFAYLRDSALGQTVSQKRSFRARVPSSSASCLPPSASSRIPHETLNSQFHISGDLAQLCAPPIPLHKPRVCICQATAKGHGHSRGRVGTVNREGNVGVASFGPGRGSNRHGAPKKDLAKMISGAMPLVVLATAISALSHPPSFSWFQKQYYAPALGGIMLSIGVQLSVKDFAVVFKQPTPVLVGYLAQYALKPLLGYAAVVAFGVPPMFASGLLLTACVAGAQLSSYAAFLSGGDVALSIVLTSITTITSVLVTPLLTQLLIGAAVPIDVVGMAKSIMQVVVGPVFLGLALNTYAKRQVDAVRPYVPLVGMLCTSLCIGSPLAMNRAMLLNPAGARLLAPVVAFHVASFAAGYWFSKLPFWNMDDRSARTISLCTGMQSSTLAMLLATQFFGPTAAVPPAVSVVFMALAGLSLATFWGRGYEVRSLLNGVGKHLYLTKMTVADQGREQFA